jgi:hypothetical protein
MTPGGHDWVAIVPTSVQSATFVCEPDRGHIQKELGEWRQKLSSKQCGYNNLAYHLHTYISVRVGNQATSSSPEPVF